MFKRPYTSKTTTPIRSSDLRKLRSELSELFLLSKDSLKLLLPDGSLSGKATTHLDEPVTIYYASPSGGENGTTMTDPRFFRIGKGNEGLLVPTIYTFNLLMGEGNTLLPRLETAREVVENLTSGSGQSLSRSRREGELILSFGFFSSSFIHCWSFSTLPSSSPRDTEARRSGSSSSV